MSTALVAQVVRIFSASACATAFYALAPLDRFGGWPAAALLVVLLASFIPLSVARARRVAGSPRPAFDAAESLMFLLTLTVVGFATVYYALALGSPGQMTGISTKVDALYYSVSVLSTVGFGDVTADGQAARLAVTVQMLFDVVVVALAVRLLGRAFMTARPRPAGAGDHSPR